MRLEHRLEGISRLVSVVVVVVIIVIAAAVGGIYVLSKGSPSSSGTTLPSTSISSSSFSLSTRSTLQSTSTSDTGSESNITQVTCTSSDFTTYHCDNSRDGSDSNETSLSNPSVSWTSPNLDGAVYAEPLAALGQVFVATENDSFYSLNASTGSIIWRTNVGNAVTNSLPCGDINPLGITGTPVIDLSSRTIYAVAEITGGYHFLFGLNMNSGAVVLNRSVDPSGMREIIAQQQRPALSLNDGIVYIEFGGLDGDCATYNGWVVGAQLNSSKLYSFEDANFSGDNQGGIWEVGGASISPNGNLYIATGNSANSNASLIDYGDSVIELSPTLQVISYFAPSDWISLNQGDVDLGTTGPILIDNSQLAFQVGKEGVGYLLNPTNLGGINGSLFSSQVCDSAYSADAYFNSVIYVPCTNGLFALELNGSISNPSFVPDWNTNSFTSGAPLVAGGAVWIIDTDNATLIALNPATGQTMYAYNLANSVHFQTPSSAYGKIFAGEGQQIVAISI